LYGNAIWKNFIKHLDGEMHLTYDKWHNFSISSLENIVIQYATFQKMIETLKRPDAKSAVDLFRSDFLVDMNPKALLKFNWQGSLWQKESY